MQRLNAMNVPQSCSEMLRSMLDLSETELKVYRSLLSADGQAVLEIARQIGKDRSLVQRALQNLMSAGLITRRTETLRNGGYYYAYDAVPPTQVKKELARCIENWHESLLESLNRFEEEMEGFLER
ncbi:MAG: helix-turn-helix domain-containing protein [Thermoplasmata archaeon]